MADSSRRPDYDWGRRVSHPNPVWRREPSPTRRPPGPLRSNTMDASRDPRRKRVPSRSPDGAQARKQLKAVQPYEKPAIQSNNGGSRRSSTSNGTPLQSNGIASSPHHRTSVQPSKETSKEKGGVFVNSPNTRGSANGDTSGRSTPQQKGNGGPVSNDKAPPKDSATDVEMSDNGVSTNPDSILKLLTNISSQWATQASLQIARDQAETRANRLQLEYNATHKQFGEFPAIKERKTADKQAAQKELAIAEQKLSEHKAAQTESMTALANIIGQAAEVTPSTDQVSRAEYDTLSRKCTELREELDITVKIVQNQRAQMAETKSVLDSANRMSSEVLNLQDHVSKLEQEIDSVKQWKNVSEPTLREVKNYRDAVKTAQGAADHTRKQLDNIKNDVQLCQRATETTRGQLDQLKTELKKFATNEAMNKLETQYETLDQEVAGVKKKSNEFQKDLGQIKASKVASSVAQAHAKATPTTPKDEDIEFKETVAMLSEHGPALVEKAKHLEKSLVELRGRLDDKAQEVESQLTQVWESIDKIMEDVRDEGKEPLIKRVKKLDVLVNNLRTKIQVIQPDEKPPLQQRLRQIEQGQAGVQEDLKNLILLPERLGKLEQSNAAFQDDLKNLKNDAQPQQASNDSSSLNVDLTPIYTRLDKVEEDVTKIEDQATEKDRIIVQHVEDCIRAMQKEFENVDKIRTEEITGLNTSLAVLQQKIADLDRALVTRASSEEMNSLQNLVHGRVKELKEDITKLQTQSRKASPAAQNPMLPSSGQHQYGAQVPNGVVHSPHLPNGINGSPSLQNAPAPRFSSPHGGTVAQPPPSQAQEIKRIQMELERFVGVTQYLKQRFDNLQTDEMVRQMVDQMNQMYPHAKNVENAINSLRTDLARLQSEKNEAVKGLNRLISEVTKSSTAANSKADQAANDAVSTITQLRRMSTEFREIKEAVGHVTNATNEVDKRSKQTSSICESLNRAKGDFERELKTMKTEMESTQTDTKLLSDRVVTFQGTIEAMDELLKKKQ